MAILVVPAQALSSAVTTSFIAQCALFVAVLYISTICIGDLLHRILRLPTIAGQILAGIAVGPSGINIAQLPFFASSFEINWSGTVIQLAPADLASFFVIVLSSTFTVSYLLWIAGHETDIHEMMHVGIASIAGGILGALMPIGMIVAVSHLGMLGAISLQGATGLGLIFAATSVSIPVAMLLTYNKMHLKSSKATLGAAIVDDVFAVILLSLFFVITQESVQMHGEGHHASSIWHALSSMFVVMVGFFVIGRWIVAPCMHLFDRYKISYLYAPMAHGLMLLYFAGAEMLGGLAGITGAYFAGMSHVQGDKRHTAIKQLSPFVNAVLLPLFLGSIGLQVDITVLSLMQWLIVFIVLFLAIISKFLGCYLAALLARVIAQESWQFVDIYLFGASMVARGEVGLVVATIVRKAELISSDMYIISVVAIVLTTIATPLLVSLGFSWLQENVQQDKVYTLTIGPFAVLGTTQLFNAIVGYLERHHERVFEVQLSEGRKMIDLEEEYDVKIMLTPSNNIVFEGNELHIKQLIQSLKELLLRELESIKA